MTPELHDVQLAHGRLRYVDVGSGPAILLVHGIGGNWQNWLLNIGGLAAAGYRVLAADLPGFGNSDLFPGPVTMQRYADVLVEFLEEIGVGHATFVGNSMGGLLTIETAARHPEVVDRAVLVCSGGIPLDSLRHRLIVRPLVTVLTLALRFPGLHQLLLALNPTRNAIAAAVLHDQRRVDRSVLAEALGGLSAAGFRPALRAGLGYDARRRAPVMTCPTLVLWGFQDRLLPVSMGGQLHGLIEGSRFEVWHDAGHCPMLEHPERFNELVADFVARGTPQGLPEV